MSVVLFKSEVRFSNINLSELIYYLKQKHKRKFSQKKNINKIFGLFEWTFLTKYSLLFRIKESLIWCKKKSESVQNGEWKSYESVSVVLVVYFWVVGLMCDDWLVGFKMLYDR